jgi:hypothetical protein
MLALSLLRFRACVSGMRGRGRLAGALLNGADSVIADAIINAIKSHRPQEFSCYQ